MNDVALEIIKQIGDELQTLRDEREAFKKSLNESEKMQKYWFER